MARSNNNLLELDVEKLFEEHKIEEVIEIEKLLDAEIERKRVELRSMVGDRYKDVLAASDAIKNMKTISQDIVNNIQQITFICEDLITDSSASNSKVLCEAEGLNERRILIIQARLAIFMNEQIWTTLDRGDNLTAAQFYLLAQHIHMGLSLSKKEYLAKFPLLQHIKANLQTLKNQIFARIKQKLECVEITAEETSSNLNSLFLLKNQSISKLLGIFIDHRKMALNTVMNTSHDSVRIQISAMVTCLITTIHLLHDCFMCFGDHKKGLIWQQLQEIVEDSSIPTLSKIDLPVTPLMAYIPDLIKQFRPKYTTNIEEKVGDTVAMEEWLQYTKLSVKTGLKDALKLVTNIKGLHIIREEALKIEVPREWEKICAEANLPVNFNVWHYFFQDLITSRAKQLISNKIATIFKDLEQDICSVFNAKQESDLREYTWKEEPTDISHTENKHSGLSMKTLGYSQQIVNLCETLNGKYKHLLIDVSQYLYGIDFIDVIPAMAPVFTDVKMKNKFIDKQELENHLRIESTNKSVGFTVFLQDFIKSEVNPHILVMKSLVSARFLQAVTTLCPHFNRCCTFSRTTEDWIRICTHFSKSSVLFWENWIKQCAQNTEKESKRQFSDITACSMISVLLRWDIIEIQEQTEEKIFKSQIKVPLKPSLILHNILNSLNDELSYVLPHTLPKQIHLQFIERNTEIILNCYEVLSGHNLNQNQSLQFLFDVKFLTTLCIPRENTNLISTSQEICDKLRAKIDPFDLDVFYSYLQTNVKRAVFQSQGILGCLLPSSTQLDNLGLSEKGKDQEKDPSILAVSVPSIAFPLFCTFAHQMPSQKVKTASNVPQIEKVSSPQPGSSLKKTQDPAAAIRSSAAALFGGLTTDWFS